MLPEVSPDIIHYGVKGMKWGVRKQRPPSQGRKKKTNAQRVLDKITAKKQKTFEPRKVENNTKRRRISDLSDEELRKVINRMEMERKYSQLTAKEVSKGRKFANEVLYNSAKATATTYTTKAMTKAIEKLLSDRGRS